MKGKNIGHHDFKILILISLFFNEAPYVENFAKPTFCLLFAKKLK
jgi:hypothetical protein